MQIEDCRLPFNLQSSISNLQSSRLHPGRLPMKHTLLLAATLLLLNSPAAPAAAQPETKASGPHFTTPKEHLGFNLGDDYCLANYQQLMSYWAKLEKESSRLKVVKIGVTEED